MTDSPQTITVRVLFTIRKRGGKKLVIASDGTESGPPARHRVDNAMVKALARAFRWRKLMESGEYGSIEELAAAEKINTTYISRVMRMTLLAPDLVDAILDGRSAAEISLATLMRPFPAAWTQQELHLTRPISRVQQLESALRHEQHRCGLRSRLRHFSYPV